MEGIGRSGGLLASIVPSRYRGAPSGGPGLSPPHLLSAASEHPLAPLCHWLGSSGLGQALATHPFLAFMGGGRGVWVATFQLHVATHSPTARGRAPPAPASHPEPPPLLSRSPGTSHPPVLGRPASYAAPLRHLFP